MECFGDVKECCGAVSLLPLGLEECPKPVHYEFRQFVAIRFLQQTVSRAFDGNELAWRGNQLDRALQFRDRTECVAGSADEESRNTQTGEMGGPQLRWPARRMQRVRKQEQTFGQCGVGRHQHTCLTSAVGDAAEKSVPWHLLLHESDSPPQSVLIMLGIRGRRWTGGTPLTKRQVAAKSGQSRGRELCRQGNQQRSVAITAGAVSEYHEAGVRVLSTMKKAANRSLVGRVVGKRLCCAARHDGICTLHGYG